MLIDRTIEPALRRLFDQYPVVTLTGPRQSGKTTLCRATFPDLPYINLESPDQRAFAIDDPRRFLDSLPRGAILDEIQRAPDLTSYLQVRIDETGTSGQYILTGSQQLVMNARISQSLAGRTGILRLLPFSIDEASRARPDMDVDEMIVRGFFPEIYDRDLNPTQALGDYLETYIERDVRQVAEIRDLAAFQTFVGLCAGRTGQLLNKQSLGNDAGVSRTAVDTWLNVLEASYVIFRVQPYHANLSKRLIKSPKLYFHDVGFAAYLLGVEHASQVATHPLRGALFENLIVSEALKYRTNRGRRANFTFYRDSSGLEVDLLYPRAHELVGIEIKSGATVNRDFFRNLERLSALLPSQLVGKILVHAGKDRAVRSGTRVTDPYGFVEELARFDQD